MRTNWKNYFDCILRDMYQEGIFEKLFLMVLYRGEKLPLFSVHMPLSPEPPVNIPFDDFPSIYKRILNENRAAHDGAVMVKLPKDGKTSPIITGWSYRLFAPPIERKTTNKSGVWL